LQNYHAVSALVPPTDGAPTSADSPVVPSDTQTGSTACRWFNRRITPKLIAILVPSVWLALQIFIVFIMPRISSRLVLDTFWGSLECGLMSLGFYSASPCFVLGYGDS
jgi:hypothetical protein